MPDWKAIEAEYGSMSTRKLAERHGVTEGAIRKRKAKGWAEPGVFGPRPKKPKVPKPELARTEPRTETAYHAAEQYAVRTEPEDGKYAPSAQDGKKVPGRPFKPGNPGRPKGSRNKLGEAFIAALHDDFIENGPETIQRVREEKPDQYLKVVASILPKELKVTTEVELSDDELDRRIRQLAAALELEIGGEGGTGEAAGGETAPGRTH